MLKSMTGYGRSLAETAAGNWLWELRAVNHRQLDISLRLPERWRALEPVIRERLTALLHRGKLELSLNLSGSGAAGSGALTLDEIRLQSTLATLARTVALAGQQGVAAAPVDPLALLQLPGVLTPDLAADDAVQRQLLMSLDQALADCIASRVREGQQIGQMLSQRCEAIGEQLARVRVLRPTVVARQKARLEARLASLGVEAEPSRLEQELVFAAQRLDIDEELDRLEAHLVELGRVLQRDEPVGRRLDFVLQELNREANTVGSKSSDVDTTGASIEIKVLIEQMREQVQNLE